MSEWVVPVELETGVPLVIEPNLDGLPPAGLNNFGADWHHAIYPKSRKELTSDSGLALRQARIEWVDYDDHRSYHYYFDDFMENKWDIPKTNVQRFGMLVLMAAHYVPKESIRISENGPLYVELDEKTRNNLWNQNILKIAKESKVFEFVRDFILEQDIESAIEQADIEEFVYTSDDNKRLILGDILLEFAAEIATEKIKPIYQNAIKEKLISPGIPKDPKDLIIKENVFLGTEKRKRKARTALRNTFIKKHGLTDAKVA